MKNILNICRKELKKIFQDKRMVFSVIILPGLMLFAVYALMGSFMNNTVDRVEEHKSIIYVDNATDKFLEIINTPNFNVEIVNISNDESANIQNIKDDIYKGKIDALIVFTAKTDVEKETAKVYYNSGEGNSNAAYSKISSALIDYNKSLQIENNVDPDIIQILTPEVIVDEVKAGAKALGLIVPMLIVIFIFASALSISAEAIAGEKERNTLATLLVTPIKRSEIIIGKIASSVIITILSALSSFIGLMGSLPMMGNMFGTNGISLNYSFVVIIGILLMIILIALYGVVMILSASVYAKNIKEASTLAMPIYMIGIFVPLFAGLQESVPSEVYYYLIPFYNSIIALKGLISLDYNVLNIALTFVSSIVYIGGLIYFLTYLFKKESILFKK